jgi:hypothetical protein
VRWHNAEGKFGGIQAKGQYAWGNLGRWVSRVALGREIRIHLKPNSLRQRVVAAIEEAE